MNSPIVPSNYRILIVEDNPDEREVYARVLGGAGWDGTRPTITLGGGGCGLAPTIA